MQPVLLLNQDFAPLQLCWTPRALALIGRGRAEVVACGGVLIAAAIRPVARPAVIRRAGGARLPLRRPTHSRRTIHRRDEYTCQYCGVRTGRPTLDHVVPWRLGGGATWTNLVTACRDCNQRKGGS